jgi:lipoprotein-anchoring transpeptidase ErfK/SrfK
VSVGPIRLGGSDRAAGLRLVNGFLGAPLRFTFENVYWSAARAQLGAELDPATTFARALAARPGSHLQLRLSIDEQRLRAYLTQLDARVSHAARNASIRLVGTRAVVAPAAIRTALDSGQSERLRLIVQAAPRTATTPVKAVIVRLGRQTLTAYLNGKPVLTTPITTGRAALPTPVGSYHVLFRASPFVFHSPWPPGNPYWYPDTPVTWAMDFFNGDFLHDDPGEPTSAFGAGSEYGPYASHGCVHVPHAVMAFLYRWLPVGAQVVVATD